MRRQVYVVEMKQGKSWHPTVGCALTKYEAEREQLDWEEKNPEDEFRITKYEAVR